MGDSFADIADLMKVTTKIIFLLLLIGICVGTADAQSSAQAPASTNIVRLAIGGLGMSNAERQNQLSDLMAVKLSSVKGLELVERQSLETALKEAELSASGAVRAKDAIRVGRLLRADWFLLGASANVKGTNAILVRLVDARTGVIRELGIFFEDSNLHKLVDDLSDFLNRALAKTGESRSYLAIGGFQDLSINNRLAAFPNQVRTYLTKTYQQDPKVALLERELVTALLNEVRMDFYGLTAGGGTNDVSPMKSAFWIVDGYFQSYEVAGAEVDFVLRVERILGGRRLISLRGKPNEEFFARLVKAINVELATNAPMPLPPNAKDEIEAQLARGKQRSGIRDEHLLSFDSIGNYIGGEDFRDDSARLRRNIDEAIQALETVLLLNPDHQEAKFYLATCLLYPPLGRIEEARNYYREVIGANLQDKWTDAARWTLSHSYIKTDKRKALELFRQFANQSTDKEVVSKLQFEADLILRQLCESNEITTEQHLIYIDEQISRRVQLSRDRAKAGTGFTDFSFDGIKWACGSNPQMTMTHVNELLPKLKERFPEMTPYLLLKALPHQTTNSPVIQEFRESLQWCAKNPEKIPGTRDYFQQLTWSCEWAFQSKLYDVMAQIAETRTAMASKGLVNELFERHKIILGFSYMNLNRWQEALNVFESFGDKTVKVGSEGPWGNGSDPFSPAKAAVQCREHLGLVPTSNAKPLEATVLSNTNRVGTGQPSRFELGQPFLSFNSKFAFLLENNLLWIGEGSALHRFGINGNEIGTLRLDKQPYTRVTSLCLGDDKIWIGTRGDGLLAYDKTKKSFRKFTDNDGLLLNEVSCLLQRENMLWIGFGHQGPRTFIGGVGQLDLETQKITSFTPPLRGDIDEADSTRDQAALDRGGFFSSPRTYVRTLIDGGPNLVYAIADEKGMKRYWKPIKQWTGLNADWKRDERDVVTCLVSDSPMCLIAGYRASSNKPLRPDCYSGGISIRTCQKAEWADQSCAWERFNSLDGLPDNNVTALAFDGDDLWVAGPKFIAAVNLKERKVRKTASIDVDWVDKLLVAGGYLWIQIEQDLYRLSLQSLR